MSEDINSDSQDHEPQNEQEIKQAITKLMSINFLTDLYQRKIDNLQNLTIGELFYELHFQLEIAGVNQEVMKSNYECRDRIMSILYPDGEKTDE